MTTCLGVDVGGSGIKAAIVDLDTGDLLTERVRRPTPRPSTPAVVAATVRDVAAATGWDGPAGVAIPSVVIRGVAHSAANIDPQWIGCDAAALLADTLGAPVTVLNDADAAGLAEAAHGAARGVGGTVLLLTIGTGIGSALLVDGRLVPNTELGHLLWEGAEAEDTLSGTAREDSGLTWPQWAERFDRFLRHLEGLIWPDLIVLGGGASKQHAEFLHLLRPRARIVPAVLLNDAGIVGAAMASSAGPP